MPVHLLLPPIQAVQPIIDRPRTVHSQLRTTGSAGRGGVGGEGGEKDKDGRKHLEYIWK